MSEFPFATPPAAGDIASPVIVPPISALNSKNVVNIAFETDRRAIAALAANYQMLNNIYLGAGRFVGATIDTGENPVAGTGLTVRQPNTKLLTDGRVYIVARAEPSPYAVITGILANKTDGVEVFVGVDPATDALITKPEWQFDEFPTGEDLESVRGLLHIGLVETDATSVVDITPSTRDGYGIIRPRGTGASGGGGGEGGISEEQLEAAVEVLQLQINALKKQLVPAGGQVKQQPVEHLVHEHQITREEVARTQETLRWISSEVLDESQLDDLADRGLVNRVTIIEKSQSATVGPNFGSGENSGPDFEGTGNPAKELDGTFGI